MKPYRSPSITSYNRDDVMEMMGPVVTQYITDPPLACSVDVSPSAILRNKEEDVTVSVATTGSGTFDQVEITVPGSSPFIFYQFNRAQGTESGNQWSVTLQDFVQNEAGVYDVVVTLLGGSNGPVSCSGIISID